LLADVRVSAMLNRTNRTLSALLNRLNLGTRSLAYFASVINDEQTLRIGHAHRVVMRDGMPGDQPSSPSGPTGEIPGILDSPAVSPRLIVSLVIPPRVALVEVPQPADRLCRRGESQEPSPRRVSEKRAKASRKPLTGLRWSEESGFAERTLSRAFEFLGFPAALAAASGG